ncbi:MAG: Ppx/GppA family phosphatase [Deltaproteobacteria bacterium]|jgi:exopolyphosphatase/guanosine-5'-triphosphate,3'-diphosphate pyrophosphatase|nr:Ppx/GppA family phosphatase [Deltaproteobacteria bacterium]
MPRKKLAALDLGSNTFRLLTATFADGAMEKGSRRVWQRIPRLSQGLGARGKLGTAPKKRAWQAVEEFDEIIVQYSPSRVVAGATMAFREADDGADFLAQIGRKFGWETVLLSGSDEARLTAHGVLTGLEPIPNQGLIFDIGGRSTEFINTSLTRIVSSVSLPLGVVGLTEQFIDGDPPSRKALEKITERVRALLSSLERRPLDRRPLAGSLTLVGTAGTVTTLAAMLMNMDDYDSDKVNNQRFGREEINRLLNALAEKPLVERLTHLGLHPQRADVIVAGLIMVIEIMDFFGCDELTVSDNSLLEGLWLAAADLIPLKP